VLFAAVAVGIALVRFRVSPWYPPLNDVNSDVYVYLGVGHAWAEGLLPYRDVYDIKGPFLYLLFGLFATLGPWSMWPPLGFLAALAFASLWLAYSLARLHVLSRPLAALAAVLSCAVIYLSVSGVPTSFTCEELAVPGVLLLLWLVLRRLGGRDDIAAAWWVLDGVVLGALFWSKYQVIAPWAAMLVALAVVVVRGGLSARSLGRLVVLHLAGFVIATVAILPWYLTVLPDLLRAYFLAKISGIAAGDELGAQGGIGVGDELGAQAEFIGALVLHNTPVVVALLAVLALFILRAARGGSREGLVLTIAFCLSLWASVSLVRHSNHVFVPLSFCAVALPQVLSALRARGRALGDAATVAVAALLAAACVAPFAQGMRAYGLLQDPRPVTCYQLPSKARSTEHAPVSTVFARTAGSRPILSVGTLFAARSSFVSQLVMRHRFQFVDSSWSASIGADRVQARYLQDRTFDYVWIHISGVDRFRDLEGQIARAIYTDGPSQPEQAAALASNYVPVLACNNEILLRVR